VSDRELYECIALVSVCHRRHVKRACELPQSHMDKKGKISKYKNHNESKKKCGKFKCLCTVTNNQDGTHK